VVEQRECEAGESCCKGQTDRHHDACSTSSEVTTRQPDPPFSRLDNFDGTLDGNDLGPRLSNDLSAFSPSSSGGRRHPSLFSAWMLAGFPRSVRTLLIACGITSFLAGGDILISTWSDRGVPDQTITVCRATDVASHPYHAVDVRIAPGGTLPRELDLTRDVVPPYTYGGINYAGVNWSSRGQAVWYAGCQGPGSSMPAADSPPVSAAKSLPSAVTPRQAQAPQPVLGPWPRAAIANAAIRLVAASIMVFGLLIVGAAGISVPPEPEPLSVPVSSDLYMYSRPRIRPRNMGPVASASRPESSRRKKGDEDEESNLVDSGEGTHHRA
jgi:hypothetical protein